MHPPRPTNTCECGMQYTSPGRCICGWSVSSRVHSRGQNSGKKKPSPLFGNATPDSRASSVAASPRIDDSVLGGAGTKAPSKSENHRSETRLSSSAKTSLLTSAQKRFFSTNPEASVAGSSADADVSNTANDCTMSLLLQNCSTRKRRSSLRQKQSTRLSR